jgi:AcrR family transcriptional regulator
MFHPGNRLQVWEIAKPCLPPPNAVFLKKGYERATARDIAAAAGVSLAAIGYHFRSREALLTEALLVAIGEWDRDFRQTLEAGVPRAASPRKRFEAVWAQLIRTFETHRALWIANFELFSQMDRRPEIRCILQDQLRFARSGLASLFLNREEDSISTREANTIGAFHHVLLTGMIAQWLIDPEHLPSAGDLADSLVAAAAEIGARKKKKSSGKRRA